MLFMGTFSAATEKESLSPLSSIAIDSIMKKDSLGYRERP